MTAVMTLSDAAPRSIVEERAMRPPTIGRIRPGIKVLKSSARENAKAVNLYETMVAAGSSFDDIAKVIESQCRIRDPLVPKNVPYFTCRRSDFTNPEVADEILRLYGEDRGDGLKLYRFPVLFAFNDWMSNLPNQMAAWGATGRKYFSEYGPDGTRYCKTYAKVERDPRAQRATRNFGGRTVIFRQDDSIPDGVCDPEQCPQYQSRQCNLSASFIFAVPDIKGLGLIELPTNSIYVLQKAYAAMQTVVLARGKLTGTRFMLSKREFDITRINEGGEAVRQKQMLTVLDAEIDIGALLDGAEDPAPALESANAAVALIEAGGNVHALHPDDAQADVDTHDSTGGSPEPAGQSQATSGPLMQKVMADLVDSGTGTQPESHDAKLHRMSDLLQRLGLNAEDRQQGFRVFAHTTYGRGWTDRARDVDGMNERLTQGLSDPAKLNDEINAATQAVLFGD
ncbi:hypothetical protein QYH69_23965 [Paraburkholderia sp. SARCC-3016]|uniref:recombination directionality factor n=1 Tax=Paraburkholderia sp. SARCC-3016 TaxID=3058611 RepID=UPI00280759C9|nr:hypothetical protein [Paraburkholderia sp. SARCC-3016]MDQ7980299.1 hypothetical protein [Paraburkholderia sp. SARCC-3016]